MSLTQADFDFVRTLVQKRAAIVLENDKAYLAETRLQALARREGLPSIQDLLQQLRLRPYGGLDQKVVEAMTTNETSFFRDMQPFEMLREMILPDLIRRRQSERRLNIWCAACSTGQEPYSFLFLLKEHFPSLNSWTISFTASDIATDVLEKARQGRYSQMEVNRGLPAPMLVKYFVRQGIEWQVREDLRKMISYKIINLIDPWPAFPPLDIILIRNVLIYFDVATKKQILAKARKLMHPDGYLLLGGAETTLNVDEAYERVEFRRSGCYKLRSVT